MKPGKNVKNRSELREFARVVTLFAFYITLLSYSCTNVKNEKSGGIGYRLFQLHYENSSGEKGLTTFDYNEGGILEKAVWELLDGSRNSLNYYTHDEDGNLQKKYREFSDGLTSTQRYVYNEQGHLIAEFFERSDSVFGITNYEYDGEGTLLKAKCDGLNGWFYGEITYKYDEAGDKKQAAITQKGENAGVILYTYDDNGNVTREHWDFSGAWSQTFVYAYEKCDTNEPEYYTSSNVFLNNNSRYRITEEHYDYDKKIGGPSYYFYDENGKLLRKRFDRSDDFSTETTYLYDGEGKLTKSYRHYSNGLCAVFSYEFTPNGRLTKRYFTRTDGASGSESYQYDAQSRLVEAHWENYDSWLTGVIDFAFNERGEVSEGYFQGTNGLGAQLDFVYDNNDNLVKIAWDFSSGETQTYIFQYKKYQ